MADTRAQEYKQKLDALTREAKAMGPDMRRAVLEELESANREILAALAHADPSSYSTAKLQALRGEVARIMQSLQQSLSSEVSQAQAAAYSSSASSVDAVVRSAYGNLAIPPMVDVNMLAIAQGYSADLVSGLTADGTLKINAAIQRAALGKTNLTDLIDQVGRVLNNGEATGLFTALGDRAQTVATNEVMRMQSLASDARIRQLADHHPGLMKEWVHVPAARVPRVSHLLADGQTRKPDEPFDVAGESLMYPRDPSGSAENTINCHSIQRPKVAPEVLKPTDQERALLKSAGIHVFVS